MQRLEKRGLHYHPTDGSICLETIIKTMAAVTPIRKAVMKFTLITRKQNSLTSFDIYCPHKAPNQKVPFMLYLLMSRFCKLFGCFSCSCSVVLTDCGISKPLSNGLFIHCYSHWDSADMGGSFYVVSCMSPPPLATRCIFPIVKRFCR